MKIFKTLSILALTTTLFTSVASASSASPPANPNLNSIEEVHEYVVDSGFASLNNDGTLSVNTTELLSKVNSELLDNYKDNLEDTNDIILATGGAITFDQNYDLNIGTQEEITEGVFQTDQGQQFNNDLISIMADPDAPPYLNAYYIAGQNRTTIKNFYKTLATGIGGNVTSAYSATVGFWVGKVQPRGAWDYKTVSGYTPYNKLWTAKVKNGTQFSTSEWFGNYNYGFTGKELFSLSILFAGGDGAGIVFGSGPDDETDKASIRQGYNESP